MNRNDAPVSLELPIKERTMDEQPPQKTPSKRDTSTDEIQTPSVNRGLQATIDKMTQDTRDHSRGSNESHKVLLTDLHKSPLQSPDGGEKSRGCKVSPSAQHSQVDTAIKTVKETEIQNRKKVEGKEVGKLVQSDSGASNEKVEMETESSALHMVEHTETENTKDAADKDSDVIIVDASNKQTEKSEHTLKIAEETSSELHNITLNTSDPVIPRQRKTPKNTNLSKLQIKDLQEIQKPVVKVISIAELLRLQIKALDSTLANSVTTIPAHADLVHDPTTTSTETCEDLKDDDGKCKPEVKKSMSDRKTGTNVEDSPPRNIKETLMEVYHQLKMDQEQIQTQGATSPPVQALEKPLLIPPISVVDTGNTTETARLHDSAKKYGKGVIDICQETGASVLASNLSGTVSQAPGAPLTVTAIKLSAQGSNVTVLKHTKDEPVQDKDMGFIQQLTPEIELNSKTKRGTSETLLDQSKMDEHNTKNNSFLNVQKFPTKSELVTDIQENNLELIQQDSPMVEEFSRTDSLANPTPKVSPLLKKRSCVSSIPSATAQELASGARRKILIQKAKPEEASEATSQVDNQTQNKEVSTESAKLSASPVGLSPSPSLSRRSPLLQPPGEQTSPAERCSPLLSRRKMPPETQAQSQQPTEEIRTPKTEGKLANKDKHDPFKGRMALMLE